MYVKIKIFHTVDILVDIYMYNICSQTSKYLITNT